MHRGGRAKCVTSAARRNGALGVLGALGALGVLGALSASAFSVLHDSLIFIPDIKKRLFLLYVRTE